MAYATFEPPKLEIVLTVSVGLTLLSRYYRSFVKELTLNGNEQVMDFGSGSGACSRHIAAALKQDGGHLDCVDISRRWLATNRAILKGFNNVGFHAGHITQVDIKDATYEVIAVHYVLHDIPDDERAIVIQTLARKLKAGGKLIIREPSDPRHGISLEALQSLFAQNGFELIESNSATVPLVGEFHHSIYSVAQDKYLRDTTIQDGQ